MTSTMTQHVEHAEDFAKAHVEAYSSPQNTKMLANSLMRTKRQKNDVVKQERGFGVEAVKDATTT